MTDIIRGSLSQRRTDAKASSIMSAAQKGGSDENGCTIRRELLQLKVSRDRNVPGAGPWLPEAGVAKAPACERCKEFRQCGLASNTVPSFPELSEET
jgi:hypothetical protein